MKVCGSALCERASDFVQLVSMTAAAVLMLLLCLHSLTFDYDDAVLSYSLDLAVPHQPRRLRLSSDVDAFDTLIIFLRSSVLKLPRGRSCWQIEIELSLAAAAA